IQSDESFPEDDFLEKAQMRMAKTEMEIVCDRCGNNPQDCHCQEESAPSCAPADRYCTFCHRYNHLRERCFQNPESSNYRPPCNEMPIDDYENEMEQDDREGGESPEGHD